MSKYLAISVFSEDQPGIIAAVTGQLAEMNGDLADLKQTVLHGYFSMLLTVRFKRTVTCQEVKQSLESVQPSTKIYVTVLERGTDEPVESTCPSDAIHVVTVQGENRTGLVAGIAEFCYLHKINILDLDTTLADGLYSMVLKLDLRKVDSIESIAFELDKFSRSINLKNTFQHNDLFKAMNEITM